MATLEMAIFGAVSVAWEASRFNMAVNTSQQKGLNRLQFLKQEWLQEVRLGE